MAWPYFRSEERWAAIALLTGTIALQLVLVGVDVANNYWRNAFFQTLQDKNWPGFLTQFGVYALIAVFYIVATAYQRYLSQWLTIRWRRWLTAQTLDRWLDQSTHFRASLLASPIDNPDQRIAEDVRNFIDVTLVLTIGLIGAIAKFTSFVAILWTLSQLIPLTLFGKTFVLPGYLVWAALLYAVAGSVMTHWIGRRLIPLDVEQEKREADFRFSLVRLRENGEAVASLRGEQAERSNLDKRFAAIADNWRRIMKRQLLVALFTSAYRRYSVYFPYFAMSPLFFGGTMQLGAFMQSGSAFNEVRSSFSYFIESYLKFAELSAVTQRLAQFQAASDPMPVATRLAASDDFVVEARNVAARSAAGDVLAAVEGLSIRKGETLLLTGASGSGKTSLLRIIAGIWPYVAGDLRVSASSIMLLPQRAYMPLGSLRNVLAYPDANASHDDDTLHDMLALVALPHLTGRLDDIERWDKQLSEGEKQRLSIVRALLKAPDLLLIDEATSALDPHTERSLHLLLRERLPRTTIIAVSHNPDLAAIYERSYDVTRGGLPKRVAH